MNKAYLKAIILFSFISLVSCRPRQLSCSYPAIEDYEPKLAYDGYNLLNGCEIYDMQGNRIISYPGNLCGYFQNGDIIATIENQYLLMYEKDLTTVWKIKDLPFVGVHHEIFVAPDSTIYFLSSEHKLYKKDNAPFRIPPIIDSVGKPMVDTTMNIPMGDSLRFDVMYHVSRKGEIMDKWSSFDHLKELKDIIATGRNSEYADTLRRLPQEYFHFNSIQTLPHNPYESIDSSFRAGNLLISEMYFDFIAILDPKTFNILWSYFQPEVSAHGQHSARMLPNGNILMLVNQNSVPNNPKVKYSKAVELNPSTKQVEWEYIAAPPHSFYSEYQGDVQRLPNGNTLITVDAYDDVCPSRSCRTPYAFEITRNKQMVWKWIPYDPAKPIQSNKEFYRVERLPKKQLEQFLEKTF